jgi:glycerol-1-phosphate dehydrogenase [NAD(P)+]
MQAKFKSHDIELPKKVVVGDDIIYSLPEYLNSLALEGPYVIVCGSNKTKDVAKEVSSYLKDFHIFNISIANIEAVESVETLIRETRSKTVIGVGGGKAIDVAKHSAFKSNTKFVSLPTSPSHDGITSPFASIKGLGKPISVRSKIPELIFIDLKVLYSAPQRLIRAGFGDVLGKFTSVLDWKLAHKLHGEYYGGYSATLALMSAKHIYKSTNIIKKDYKEGLRILVEALISSGVAMGIAGSTRPASGSEHLFAHAVEVLAKEKDLLHGELVALGTIMMAYLHNISWAKIRKKMKVIGLPVKAKEIGLSNETIIKALTMAHLIRPERYTILGERGLTEEAAEKLAIETGVID